MADDSLLGLGSGDLIGFQNQVVQSDPYGLAGQSLGSWQPDMRTWDPATQGVTSFTKSFLAGLLGNYARENAASQLNSVIGVLPQLRNDPLTVTAPEGVDANAFASLKGTAILKDYAKQQAEDEAKKPRMAQLLNTILGEGVRSGDVTPEQAIAAMSSEDPAAALKTLQGDTAGVNGESLRMKGKFDALGITDPVARAGIRNQDDLDLYVRTVQGREEKSAAASEKANAKLEKDLRTALERPNTPYQAAVTLAPLMKIADQIVGAEEHSPQGDLALLDVLNKTYNPGGVLREGLMQMSKDAMSPLNRVRAELENVLTSNGATFSPQGRQQIYNVIKQGIAEKLVEGKKYADSKIAITKGGGGNPDQVIPSDYYDHLFGGLKSEALKQSVAPVATSYGSPQEYLKAYRAWEAQSAQ